MVPFGCDLRQVSLILIESVVQMLRGVGVDFRSLSGIEESGVILRGRNIEKQQNLGKRTLVGPEIEPR